MAVKLSGTTISKIYIGNTGISKAYLGYDLVYGSQPPVPVDRELSYIGNGDDVSQAADVWFNTGYVPSVNYMLRVYFSTSQFTNTQVIAGLFDSVHTPAHHFSIHSPRNSSYAVAGLCGAGTIVQSNDARWSVTGQPYNFCTFCYYGANRQQSKHIIQCSVSGSTGYTDYQQTFASDTEYNNFPNMVPVEPLYIFGRNNVGAGEVDNLCYGGTKIYRVQVWRGVLIMSADFQPYLHNGVPCFKDNISGNFIYNQGSGEVTYG